MAPLPAYNLTRRYYFDYITGNDASKARQHTAMLRVAFDSAATDTQVQDKFLNILNALSPAAFRLGWKVTAVRKSLHNTDFTVPVTMTANLIAFAGTGTYTGWLVSSEAIERRFLGRSPTTGVKVSFSLYGEVNNSISDFRITSAESAGIANVISILNGATIPLFVAGDNTVPTWYPYASLNYNSYWEGELRV